MVNNKFGAAPGSFDGAGAAVALEQQNPSRLFELSFLRDGVRSPLVFILRRAIPAFKHCAAGEGNYP
jgi:hypothetical protein